MSRIVYHKGNYIITEEHSKSGYIVINTAGTYQNHGHLKTLKVSKLIIELVEQNKVPFSDYLRHTALRLTLDDDYKMDIIRKIEKEKDKNSCINGNKGVVRK